MPRRTLTTYLALLVCAIVLFAKPTIAFAEESQPQTVNESVKRTFVVNYDPNGGEGSMAPSTFVEGDQAKLTRCSFTRSGYTFEGWSTTPDESGTHFADGADATSLLTQETTTLYALWGSQIYLIRYAPGVSPGNGSPATGSTQSQLAVHDAEVSLMPCGFERKGYTPTGWMDPTGQTFEFEAEGTNFVEGTSTASWQAATISLTQIRPEADNTWTCQGSVVFDGENGNTYVAICFVYYDDNYKNGSLETYDSEIAIFNLETGELVKHASGLMLEHANDIAYNPDNGHFYVAQGGLFEGFPDGIVELDENLAVVRTVTPEGTHHIWNITYANGTFYAIGNVNGDSFARGNPTGDTSDLIRLDKDLNVIDQHAIDFSGQGFSGQGMAADDDYLYAILVNFAEHDAGQKQRLSIFTLDGEPRGTQRIDINIEVESASWLNNRMYFSVNGRAGCTVFGTDLAATTMTAMWQPNEYSVAFDANGVLGATVPDPISTRYDTDAHLPATVPVCAGYAFSSWNTSPDGSGTAYVPGQTVKNLAESGTITLYAQWKRPAMALVGDNGKSFRGKRFKKARATPPRVQEATSSNATLFAAILLFGACALLDAEGDGPFSLAHWGLFQKCQYIGHLGTGPNAPSYAIASLLPAQV